LVEELDYFERGAAIDHLALLALGRDGGGVNADRRDIM
jgi:hypothetical protein